MPVDCSKTMTAACVEVIEQLLSSGPFTASTSESLNSNGTETLIFGIPTIVDRRTIEMTLSIDALLVNVSIFVIHAFGTRQSRILVEGLWSRRLGVGAILTRLVCVSLLCFAGIVFVSGFSRRHQEDFGSPSESLWDRYVRVGQRPFLPHVVDLAVLTALSPLPGPPGILPPLEIIEVWWEDVTQQVLDRLDNILERMNAYVERTRREYALIPDDEEDEQDDGEQ